MRSGLTLLECLVAIFIVAIGMIGTFALLPVAQRDVQTAQEHGHVGAAGRGAWQEVKIRRVLRPSKWMVLTGGEIQEHAEQAPFCIDPLFVARQIELWGKFQRIGRFPFSDYTSEGGVKVVRATLREWEGSDKPMFRQQADRIFTWEDDLLFSVTDEDNQIVMTPQTLDGEQLAVKGRFSWLVMGVPVIDLYGVPSGKYTASVVVFKDRPIDDPAHGERLLDVDLTGGGYAGGDIKIFSPPATSLTRGSQEESALNDALASGSLTDLLKLRPVQEAMRLVNAPPGEWMMLTGRTNRIDESEIPPLDDADPRKLAGYEVQRVRPVFQWYEIIAAGPAEFDRDTGVATRRLTIKGANWPAGSDSGQVHPDNTSAALFTGAAGVFEKTVELP